MEVHTFPKGVCTKVNVIARLEFELAYNASAVHLTITPQGHPTTDRQTDLLKERQRESEADGMINK